VPADNREDRVLGLLGSLADAVARDDPAAVAWLAGMPGRRLVVGLGGVIALHRPDQPGGCAECRSLRAPCLTWDVLTRALTDPAEDRLGTDFRSLLRRYGGDRMRADR
jgi:hypothetical protein